LHGLAGNFGLSNPAAGIFDFNDRTTNSLLIAAGLAAVWLLPNTQEFMRGFHPAYESVAKPKGWTAQFTWQPDRWWTWCSVGILCAMSILMMSPARVSEFLYYQF
jgi:hypothetical protein